MKEIDIFINELNMVCWTEIDKEEVISRLKEIKHAVTNIHDSKSLFTEKELLKHYICYNSGYFGMYKEWQEQKVKDFLTSEYYKKLSTKI